MEADALHKAMLRPDTYPSEEGPVRFIETHVSRLYFTSGHVYKIKKPVNFGFLNFTTLDRRRFYCAEEVRLNDRFAPGTYLGVVDIRRRGGRFSVGGEGEIVEHAVRMKRLPEERMLDRLLCVGDPSLGQEMERVGERLRDLMDGAERCRNEGGQSNLEIVRINWRENFSQTHPFEGGTLEAAGIRACEAYVDRFLGENSALLLRRESEGWVRDGHGDLHAEHICLTDPVRIYDCIEFNRRFRIADVAADLAFLLMDLDYRGRRDLARRLLETCAEALGPQEETERLLPFYKIYRAWVRGKVDSFLSAAPEASAEVRKEAEERARRYFNLALGYLCPPLLIVTGGLMGSGKSTVAAALSQTLGAELLRSDEIRKELAGEAAGRGKDAPFGQGIYSPDFDRLTYDTLLKRTEAALDRGATVIADAAFGRREQRERFMTEARRRGIPALLLRMHCPRQTALERLDERMLSGEDPSDGRRELYDLQEAAFEEGGTDAFAVDTTRPLSYNIHLIVLEIIAGIGTCR